jgi:hypothetical protein
MGAMPGNWFNRSPSETALDGVLAGGNKLGVFTLELTGVADPFDPDPLWDRRYGGRSDIAERLTGDRDFRLQAVLDGCRNSLFERDSAGRFREVNPVFTDVVMWIPKENWRADAMRGGGRIEALQHTLTALHEEKFSRSLPEDRNPRYTVMADPGLAEDSVVIQFGFGVFVPGEEDILDAEIGLLRDDDDEVVALPPWVFWQNGAQIRRPVGVYRRQRSLLISGDGDGPIRPELWFERRVGHLLVNLNEDDAERIYSSTGEIRVARSRTPESEPHAIEWRLDCRAEEERESLWMRITPVGPVAPVRAPEVEEQPAAAQPQPAKSHAEVADPTVLVTPIDAGDTSESTPLSTRFALQLAGLGLFRIDGSRMPGMQEWVIWFDDWGWPVREAARASTDEARCLALRSQSGSDRLEVRPAGGKNFEVVASLPQSLETPSAGELELLPPPDPGRYLGLLMLNASVALPLSSKPLTLGRATTSDKAEPDLPVDLLDHPESAVWDKGVRHAGARLDAIELSRRHLTVRLMDGQLEVGMARGNAPAFTLDERGGPLAELPPKSPKSATLEPGQHLLVGGYVFRFQQETAHNAASTGGHMIPRARN